MNGPQQHLTVIPCELSEANAFIATHHRHHEPLAFHRFSLAVADEDDDVRGVAVVGRPANRLLDDGWTCEVSRLATDGCPNACSALYAAAWRATKALGYRKLITYTLNSEPGTSLIAAGWRVVAESSGGSWSRKSRPRVDKHPLQGKLRWEAP